MVQISTEEENFENKSDKKWTTKTIKALIELRHSVEWEEQFNSMKGKSRQITNIWNDLAAEISTDISGQDARVQYNYLVNQYKKHNQIAKRSGEGGVKWRFYDMLKQFISKSPVITPIATLDSNKEDPLKISTLVEDDSELASLSSFKSPIQIKAKSEKRNSLQPVLLSLIETMTQRGKTMESLLKLNDESKLTNEINEIKSKINGIDEKFDLIIKRLNKD